MALFFLDLGFDELRIKIMWGCWGYIIPENQGFNYASFETKILVCD